MSFQVTDKTWRKPGAKEKTTYKINCKWLIIKWAQMGSNHRPPDYEFHIGIYTGLHRFVLVVIVIHLRISFYIHCH
jgi:hypothetical protein